VSWDPYLDLEAGVLRNRLGVTDPDQLRRAETGISTMRIAQLAGQLLPGQLLPGDYDPPGPAARPIPLRLRRRAHRPAR